MVIFPRQRARRSSRPLNARVAAAAARAASAACEALEPRAYWSASFALKDLDRDGTLDLKVTGSSSKEHVVIIEDAVAGTTTLWLDQDGNNLQNSKDVIREISGPLGTISVDLGSGDDLLEYRAVSSLDAIARSLEFDTGSGNDRLIVDTSGENNGLFGSVMTCDFDLDSGNDSAFIKMGAVDNSQFRLNLDGYTGNDVIDLWMLADIPASLVDIDVNLGSGKNTLDIGSIATISDGSNVFRDVKGGTSSSEYDRVTTFFTNDVENARLLVGAVLNGGNDSFTNSFDLQEFDILPLGLVRFSINGGDGTDTLAVNRGGTSGPADIEPGGLLDVRLTGGNGNDKVTLDLGGNVENNRGLFLTGRLVAKLDGQAGNDVLTADMSFSYDPASFGDMDLSLYGGTGNDTINFNLLDFFPLDPEEPDDDDPDPDEPDEIPEPPQVGFTYGPTGFVNIDGGTGGDATTLSGTVLTNIRVRATEKLTVIPFTDVYSS